MTLSLQELGLEFLNREERIAVAHALLKSVVETDVADETDPVLTDAQRAELERRLEDSVRRPDATTPWEVVRERTLSRVKP
jgi:putative addiction module component (TIGR02574 family)